MMTYHNIYDSNSREIMEWFPRVHDYRRHRYEHVMGHFNFGWSERWIVYNLHYGTDTSIIGAINIFMENLHNMILRDEFIIVCETLIKKLHFNKYYIDCVKCLIMACSHDTFICHRLITESRVPVRLTEWYFESVFIDLNCLTGMLAMNAIHNGIGVCIGKAKSSHHDWQYLLDKNASGLILTDRMLIKHKNRMESYISKDNNSFSDIDIISI